MNQTNLNPDSETVSVHQDMRQAWNSLLDVLLEQIEKSVITYRDVSKLKEEIELLHRAAKGRQYLWTSVLEIGLIIIEKDASTRQLLSEVRYDRSTISRALNKLLAFGFVTVKPSSTFEKVWTINQKRCPILYRLTRTA